MSVNKDVVDVFVGERMDKAVKVGKDKEVMIGANTSYTDNLDELSK